MELVFNRLICKQRNKIYQVALSHSFFPTKSLSLSRTELLLLVSAAVRASLARKPRIESLRLLQPSSRKRSLRASLARFLVLVKVFNNELRSGNLISSTPGAGICCAASLRVHFLWFR